MTFAIGDPVAHAANQTRPGLVPRCCIFGPRPGRRGCLLVPKQGGPRLARRCPAALLFPRSRVTSRPGGQRQPSTKKPRFKLPRRTTVRPLASLPVGARPPGPEPEPAIGPVWAAALGHQPDSEWATRRPVARHPGWQLELGSGIPTLMGYSRALRRPLGQSGSSLSA